MKPLLIIKTGQTIAPLLETGADFEDWIIAGTGLDQDQFRIVPVFETGVIPGCPSDYAGIMVTGSPAYVTDAAPWSETSSRFLAQAVTDAVPVLAICYGHQLLAHGTGGRVGFHPHGREIGTVSIQLTNEGRDDLLLGSLPARFRAQVSHEQSVLELPADAVRLAGNDFEPNQAFRLGDCAWGLQFHPEFSAAITEAYVLDRQAVLRREGLDPDSILKQLEDSGESAQLLQRFARWVRGRDASSAQPPAACA